jgi:hypothetical protein
MAKNDTFDEHMRFWIPEMRNNELRERLHFLPEEYMRAIEGGRAKRALEMRTRLLEIEQTL